MREGTGIGVAYIWWSGLRYGFGNYQRRRGAVGANEMGGPAYVNCNERRAWKQQGKRCALWDPLGSQLLIALGRTLWRSTLCLCVLVHGRGSGTCVHLEVLFLCGCLLGPTASSQLGLPELWCLSPPLTKTMLCSQLSALLA